MMDGKWMRTYGLWRDIYKYLWDSMGKSMNNGWFRGGKSKDIDRII
jgi:hypothetical protein